METVNEYISRNGIEDVIKFISDKSVEYHKFAEDNDIDLDDWFEFGHFINDQLGSYRGDIIPIVDFNYIKLEQISNEIISNNAPIEYVDLVDSVANRLENATSEDVSKWYEFCDFEETEEGVISIDHAYID